MARFIIDDENISVDNLATLKKLGEKDKIYIVTNNRQKLSISVFAWFLARKIKIKIILLESAHKDYADKIITFLMGKLSHKKDKIYIVSNDKFYDDVIDFFNKQEGDLDLTTEIYKAIEIIISKEAADYFINDPIIVTTKGTASIYQRVLINRFFIQLLTRARAYMELEGLTMVFTILTNEGTHVPWMQDLNRVLFPYLKTNNVFGFFLDVQKELNNNLSKSE